MKLIRRIQLTYTKEQALFQYQLDFKYAELLINKKTNETNQTA